MKIIFLSMMFSDAESDIRKSKTPNSVSGHKFQENLIKGLYENDCNLSVMNISRIGTYPGYPKIILHTQKKQWCGAVDGVDVGFVNLPFLSYFSQWFVSFFALRKEIKKNKNEKYVLVTFNSNLHTCFPMQWIRRLYKNVTLCNIIGDLHGTYGIENRTPGLKGKLIRFVEGFQDSIGKKFDSFVFLTKEMAKAMGVEHKPHCVVEGIYTLDQKMAYISRATEDNTKKVFYAGSLCQEYGIEHLLRAFTMIEDPDYRLWLAGDGDMVPLIEKYAARDPRIQYLGFITPQEVKERQSLATVLISPRTSEHEFVKYSFASKTLECLASGKVYIAHKLPCDPPEYEDYIQYAEAESDQALRDKIVELCEMRQEQRNAIGQHARKFVQEEKNPKAMCKRIIDMWSGVLNSGN